MTRQSKHRLFDTVRKKFFVCNGEWTEDESQASTFHDVASLVQTCLRHGLKDAQMLVQIGGRRRIRVPICA